MKFPAAIGTELTVAKMPGGHWQKVVPDALDAKKPLPATISRPRRRRYRGMECALRCIVKSAPISCFMYDVMAAPSTRWPASKVDNMPRWPAFFVAHDEMSYKPHEVGRVSEAVAARDAEPRVKHTRS